MRAGLYVLHSRSTSLVCILALSNTTILSKSPTVAAYSSNAPFRSRAISSFVQPMPAWTMRRRTLSPCSSLLHQRIVRPSGICSAMYVVWSDRNVVPPASGRLANTIKSPCLTGPAASISSGIRQSRPGPATLSSLSRVNAPTSRSRADTPSMLRLYSSTKDSMPWKSRE